MTKGTGKVAVVELLKLPKAMRDIFGSVRGEYGECLRPNEVSIDTTWATFVVSSSVTYSLIIDV